MEYLRKSIFIKLFEHDESEKNRRVLFWGSILGALSIFMVTKGGQVT